MIQLSNITRVFNNKEIALRGISLVIERGELLAITGPSGSGKSTILNIIGLIEKFDDGNYLLNHQDVRRVSGSKKAEMRNKTFGYVVQNFALLPEYSVYENIQIPLEYAKCPHRERKEKIEHVLKQVGISELKHKLCSELSGGQQQRVSIARAIVNDPDIILADEPTGSLDQETGETIFSLLLELHALGKTVVIITHNEKLACRCQRVIAIEDGRIRNVEKR